MNFYCVGKFRLSLETRNWLFSGLKRFHTLPVLYKFSSVNFSESESFPRSRWDLFSLIILCDLLVIQSLFLWRFACCFDFGSYYCFASSRLEFFLCVGFNKMSIFCQIRLYSGSCSPFFVWCKLWRKFVASLVVTRSSTVRNPSSLTPTSEASYFFSILSLFLRAVRVSTSIMISRPFSPQYPTDFLPFEIQLSCHVFLPLVFVSIPTSVVWLPQWLLDRIKAAMI